MPGDKGSSRREKLERELAMLQSEVTTLCEKLHQPEIVDADQVPSATALPLVAASSGNTARDDKGKIARLQRALDETTRRRDDLGAEVRRLKAEVDKAKRERQRFAELKAEHVGFLSCRMSLL